MTEISTSKNFTEFSQELENTRVISDAHFQMLEDLLHSTFPGRISKEARTLKQKLYSVEDSIRNEALFYGVSPERRRFLAMVSEFKVCLDRLDTLKSRLH